MVNKTGQGVLRLLKVQILDLTPGLLNPNLISGMKECVYLCVCVHMCMYMHAPACMCTCICMCSTHGQALMSIRDMHV